MKVHLYDLSNPREVIRRDTERGRAKKKNAELRREPEVGIYWFYKGKIFHQDSLPVSYGEMFGDFINGPSGHNSTWAMLERNGFLDKRLPENLRDEYFKIPRGRVLYDNIKEVYIVYHGDTFTEKEYEIIREAFILPKDKTIDKIDMHYCKLPDDFEF